MLNATYTDPDVEVVDVDNDVPSIILLLSMIDEGNVTRTDRIQSVTYLNTELNSGVPLGCDFIVDILCQSTNDKHYLIEIHNDFRIDYKVLL